MNMLERLSATLIFAAAREQQLLQEACPAATNRKSL